MALFNCDYIESGGSIVGSTIGVTTSSEELYGRTVTLTDGETTLTDTFSNTGSCVFYNVMMLGALTVSATTADGEIVSETFSMLYYGQTSVELEVLPDAIYGVYWSGGSSPAMTRTDAAANFTDPSPAVSNGNGSSPFDNILPWSGMQIVDDATVGKLVSIPKYYYKWTKTGTAMTLQISMKEFDGSHVSPAHANRGDGKGERDVVYVGRYHCATSTYKSTSGVTPQVSQTRATFRTSIHNLGANIWQYDFAMYWTIMMLYLVEFANWNSQAKIGYGCSDSGSIQNTGLTDAMTYHTGTTKSNRTTYGHTQYRHIEDLWGNVLDWCDGIRFSGADIYIINNPANFSDSSGGTKVGTRPTSGYWIAFWDVPTTSGFEWALYISNRSGEPKGSESTYICDYCVSSSSGVVLRVGSGYGQGQGAGAFWMDGYNGASNLDTDVGSRLMKLP